MSEISKRPPRTPRPRTGDDMASRIEARLGKTAPNMGNRGFVLLALFLAVAGALIWDSVRTKPSRTSTPAAGVEGGETGSEASAESSANPPTTPGVPAATPAGVEAGREVPSDAGVERLSFDAAEYALLPPNPQGAFDGGQYRVQLFVAADSTSARVRSEAVEALLTWVRRPIAEAGNAADVALPGSLGNKAIWLVEAAELVARRRGAGPRSELLSLTASALETLTPDEVAALAPSLRRRIASHAILAGSPGSTGAAVAMRLLAPLPAEDRPLDVIESVLLERTNPLDARIMAAAMVTRPYSDAVSALAKAKDTPSALVNALR